MAQKRRAEETGGCVDLVIYNWTTSQVQSFLRKLQLERWEPIFEDIDGPTLTELDDADLKELGCENLVMRKKLLGHVMKLKLEAKSANDVALPASGNSQAPETVEFLALCDVPAASASVPESASDVPMESQQTHQDMTLAELHTEWEQLKQLREEFQHAASIFEKLLDQHVQQGFGEQNLARNFAQEVLRQIQEAQEVALPSPARIPVFGNTGAGKSTLLNAVLRQNVVPTSGWRSCTAVPVELTAADVPVFKGEVHLKSMDEWKGEVQAALQDLLMSDRQRVSRREPVRGKEETPADVAFATLVAVYPQAFLYARDPWPSVTAAMNELFHIRNAVTIKHAADKVLTFQNADGETLAQEVVDYIDSPERDWEPAFFPLVKKVRIVCPAGAMHPHVILVDAPGVQDANAARGNVVKKLLEDANSVVIVSNIKRAATERVAQEMLSERFRRQLLMDGHYGRLAFVASCTDELTLSELKRNLKLKGDVPKEKAAALRNASAKEKITADCFAGLRRIEIQSEQRSQSTDEDFRRRGIAPAVFTTSARDYQKLSGLLDITVDGGPQVWSTLRDTEIPDFRRWIHAQGQKAQLDALEKAEDQFSSACRKLQEPERQIETVPTWDPSTMSTALRKIKESQAAIMRTLLSDKLKSSVGIGQRTAAEEGARNMTVRCQGQGAGGLHWGTFKATCRRQGEWREDFNELLADPLNRRIAVEWDRVLNQLLPDHVDNLLRRIVDEIWKLQRGMDLPLEPFQDAEELVKRRGPVLKGNLQRQQMEVSRQIKETIKQLMTPSYGEAASVSGTGTDVRQKAIIRNQVTERGVSMFRKASDFLGGELDKLLSCLEQGLEDLVEALTSVLKASMQRLAAVGTERQALRALQQGCGAAVRQALQKSQERQRRRHALEYSAVEVEVASKPRPKSEANQTSSKAPMPSEYFCPISQEVMVDPVTTSDGHTYDRKPIEEWLRNNDTSPNTGLVLPNKTLIPNHNLRKLIQEASTAKEDSIEMELDNMICAMEVEGPLPQGEGQEEEDQLDDAEGAEEEEEEEEDQLDDAEGEEEEEDQLDDAEGAEEEEEEDQLDDAEGEPLDGVRGFEKLAAKMGDVISNATTSPGTSQSPGSSSVAETAEPQSHEEQRKLRRLSSWLRKRLWKGRP